MLRAFFALAAGFAVMTLIVVACTALLTRFAPDWVGPQTRPRAGYVFVNIGSSFLAAAAGGYVTAWIGEGNPLTDVLVLGIIVLVLSGLSALHGRGRQPIAYLVAMVALSPLGVLAGGLVRLRVVGVL